MPRMAAATTAGRAPRTRIPSTRTPTAPTAACANRCHCRQLVHPLARTSAWRRASALIATMTAPAPRSQCVHTAPTAWAVDRANRCYHRLHEPRPCHHHLQWPRLRYHRLPACAPLRALECTPTAPIATTTAPATTVAPAPSSPTASMTPTARTAARAHSRPRCCCTTLRSCAQASPASSCTIPANAFAPPSRKRRMWSATAAVCLGMRWSGSTLATD